MTYCVGLLLKDGIVFGSDSRTHAGVDDFASFCKMTVFERPGDRVLVLLSSGSLAGTQAVISVLTQGAASQDGPANLLNARRCSTWLVSFRTRCARSNVATRSIWREMS